jgi:hypothetical protein
LHDRLNIESLSADFLIVTLVLDLALLHDHNFWALSQELKLVRN